MADSLPSRLAGVKPQMLASRFAPRQNQGETDGQKVADEQKRAFGALVVRAIELGRGLTYQAVTHACGYADQSVIGKWKAGLQMPPMHKLVVIPGFNEGYILALAERHGQTQIKASLVVEMAVGE